MKEHRNNVRLDQSKLSVQNTLLAPIIALTGKTIEILEYETNFRKRNISEMIYIKGQKNGINLMKDTELLDKSYFYILDIHELIF